MGKAKTIKLPKYLKLAKGLMWFDIDGENASGVQLIATDEQFVGRGYNTDSEWNKYKQDGYMSVKPVVNDLNDNKNSEDGQYGYVKLQKDRSYFCTTNIPNTKLGHILTAYQNGILVKYDPKKATKIRSEDEKDREIFPTQQKDFAYRHDGDIVFEGNNKEIFSKLQTLSYEKLCKFIDDCTPRSREHLQDMLEYEQKGYNPLSRPRDEVLRYIRKKLNSFGSGISSIRVDED